MSLRGVSKVMLVICFVITHLHSLASLLFYSCFVFRIGVKVVLDCLSSKNYCSAGSFVDSIFVLLIKFLYRCPKKIVPFKKNK
jgi:hypothetical protein